MSKYKIGTNDNHAIIVLNRQLDIQKNLNLSITDDLQIARDRITKLEIENRMLRNKFHYQFYKSVEENTNV